jgi:hypothetical protein
MDKLTIPYLTDESIKEFKRYRFVNCSILFRSQFILKFNFNRTTDSLFILVPISLYNFNSFNRSHSTNHVVKLVKKYSYSHYQVESIYFLSNFSLIYLRYYPVLLEILHAF